jgi:hypothetical protein
METSEKIRPGSVEALRLFFDAAIPTRIRSFGDFLQQAVIVPAGPFRGQRLSFRRQPWVRLYAEQVDSGLFRKFVTTGPVQSGKSLICFVAPQLYHLFEVQEKVICGIPNLDMMATKWGEDIRPAVEASEFKRQLRADGKGSRGGAATRIEFANGSVLQFMAAGGNDKQRAGATTRIMCITEADGMDDVGHTSDEGTKIDQLLGRVRAYGDKAMIFAECSVTSEDGWIWKEYKSGTASRIMCPCPHCSEHVCPEYDDFLGWQDATNIIEAGKNSAFFCPSCGGKFTEEQRRQMNENALLVHRGQHIENGKVCGEMEPTDTLGFRWSAFNNMFSAMEQLGREEWKASQAENQELAQKTRRQQVWCVPVDGEKVDRVELTRGIVRGSAQGYAGRCNGIPVGEWPSDTQHRVAFVDVGKRFLSWQLMAGRKRTRHVVNYGDYQTDRPDVIGEEEAIESALRDLLPELATHGIEVGFVDCSNWTDLIQRVVSEIGSPWIPSHGMPKYVHPDKTTGGKHSNQHSDHWYLSRQENGVYVVNMNTNYWKQKVHNSVMVKPLNADGSEVEGIITLPGEDPNLHDEWASHILAEQFERTFKIGKGWAEGWVKKSKANHQFDCTYGNFVALDFARAKSLEETIDDSPSLPLQFGTFGSGTGWRPRR